MWINGKLISNGKEIYSVLGFPLRSTLGTKISIFINIDHVKTPTVPKSMFNTLTTQHNSISKIFLVKLGFHC